MPEETVLSTCYFCKGPITPQEYDEGKATTLRNPAGDLVGAHTRHTGTQTEKDAQLGIKPKK